jgi:uncharacterized tellurite resistance protein B-like protein
MGGLLLLILVVLAVSAAIVFSGLITRSRLAELVNLFRDGKLTLGAKLAEIAGRINFRNLIDTRRLSELIDRVDFKSLVSGLGLSNLGSRFKPDDLHGRFGSSRLVSRIKSQFSRRADLERDTEPLDQPDLSVLNCRVKLEKQQDKSDLFKVEVCGTIRAPSGPQEAGCITLSISILDVTDGVAVASPVRARAKQWSASDRGDSSAFCYNAQLGKLPHPVTTLSDWTAMAGLNLDWLEFARRGTRDLQFITSVVSSDSGRKLACTKCDLTYDNPEFGYMDLQENIERTKVLAVALGFAVSAADNLLHRSEIELIREWARDNIFEGSQQASDKACRKLDKALARTIAFFRDGNTLDVYDICRQIVEIVPVGQRYDVLDLCLHVAQANGTVTGEELAILKDLATWLEVDAEKFRIMMEKVLPIHMHEVRDAEAILGLTSDMSKEKARQHLNKQYRKWNSRVTNANPGIQSQADQMLKLIAEARGQYVAENPVLKEDSKVAAE